MSAPTVLVETARATAPSVCATLKQKSGAPSRYGLPHSVQANRSCLFSAPSASAAQSRTATAASSAFSRSSANRSAAIFARRAGETHASSASAACGMPPLVGRKYSVWSIGLPPYNCISTV